MSSFRTTLILVLGYFFVLLFGIAFVDASMAFLTPKNRFINGKLIEIKSSGRLRYDGVSTITYATYRVFDTELEFLSESTALDFFINKGVWVVTEKQEQADAYTMVSVKIGNKRYNKNFPQKVLAEAEKALKLGRYRFAQVKEKLESNSRSRSNRSQPAIAWLIFYPA